MKKILSLMMLLVAIVTGAKADVDLSQGASYDFTTITASAFANVGTNYWKADNSTTPSYYANGSDFKPTTASAFMLNATEEIAGFEGLEITTGSSTGRARIYVNGNGLYFNSTNAILTFPGLKRDQVITIGYANASSDEAKFTVTNATENQNTSTHVETLTVKADGDVTLTYNSKKFYIKTINITASTPAKAYRVNVASNNDNYGTVSSTASSLDANETATITATPKPGYEFTSWAVEGTGAELSSTTTNPTTLTIGTSDATVTATFSAVALGVTLNEASNGSYTVSVAGGAATDENTTATIGQTITLSGTPAAASFTEVSWNVKDANNNNVTVTNNQFTMPGSAVTISPVFSKPVMIKVTVGGGKAATVTGTVGGTADVSLQSDKKFGTGSYLGFTLAGGNTFQTGDIINVKITKVSTGGNTTIIIYDEDKTTPLYNTGEIGVVGDNKFVLPEEVDGKSTLYICRTSDNGWNAFVDFVEVSRPEATITLNASGFATYSSATDFEFVGADAYGMKLSATSLVGTKVTSGKIKAGEGILFKGEAGATVAITETTGAEAIGENNNLIGTTDADNEIISSSYTYKYALSGDTFKTFTGSLAANKAFFGSNTAISNSLELVFNEAGEATAVDAIAEADEAKTAPVKVIKNGKLYIGNYNVAGQQVK